MAIQRVDPGNPPLTRASIIAALGYVPSGWQTTLDVDFSAQPNQSLAANGTYTIAGVAGWQRENAANDAVGMAIVNGSGLNIQPSGGTYFNLARTAPLLWLPFSAFMPSAFSWSSGVRISAEIAADNAVAFGALSLCVDRNDQQFAYQVNRYFDGAHEIQTCNIYLGGTLIQGTNTQIPAGAASFVLQLELPALWGGSASVSGLFSAAPMPAIDNMQAMRPHTGTGLAAGVTQIPNGIDVGPLLTSMGIVIACEANLENITVKQIRVDTSL
jgi:hypothetical protein